METIRKIKKYLKEIGLTVGASYNGRVKYSSIGWHLVNWSVQKDGSWTYSNVKKQTACLILTLKEGSYILKERSGGSVLVRQNNQWDISPPFKMSNKDFRKKLDSLFKYLA